jgi:pSer/pThr/pTyr-binding forkhead associated (FHA) protein
MHSLVFVEQTPLRGRRQPVARRTTIGRQGCDVLLVDPEVSRRHAVVLETPAGPAIEDLGSTNGTFLNDRRVEGAELLHAGDIIRFGRTIWHVLEREDRATDRTTVEGVPTPKGV